MWTIVKEAVLAAIKPEIIIHLAGGYARVKLSPVEYRRVVR